MIKLGNVDSQIVWILAMMQHKGVISHKIDGLLEKLTPGHARDIGDVLAGKQQLDLAWPDVQMFVRSVRNYIKSDGVSQNTKKGKKNGRK